MLFEFFVWCEKENILYKECGIIVKKNDVVKKVIVVLNGNVFVFDKFVKILVVFEIKDILLLLLGIN